MSKKRTQALQQVAFDLGMQFAPKDEWGLFELLKDFKLFKVGGRESITNILHRKEGMLDMEVHIFDYSYTVSTGKSSVTFQQTVFFMQSKQLGLPHFWMKPETFAHRIGEWLGLQRDIDFAEHPEFSQQYWLKGEDEDYIRATINEDVMKFFTVEKEWSLEGCGYFLILYINAKLLPVETIQDLYKKGMKVCEMLYEGER
jgi:hypothetical protein